MSKLTARRLGSASAMSGEVLDPRGLGARPSVAAARQWSLEALRTDAAAYHAFVALPGLLSP
jgi:hypothetical protein